MSTQNWCPLQINNGIFLISSTRINSRLGSLAAGDALWGSIQAIYGNFSDFLGLNGGTEYHTCRADANGEEETNEEWEDQFRCGCRVDVVAANSTSPALSGNDAWAEEARTTTQK